MALWIRYEYANQCSFGTLDQGLITPHEGNMFAASKPAGEPIALSAVKTKTPTIPSKLIALWNNYHALADEKKLTKPQTPLYLIKPSNCYLATAEAIHHPEYYKGEVFYEGELGIVIGKTAENLKTAEEANSHIFGYTCINDVTAFGLLKEEDNFDQWTRAKGFDTFGVFGPVIATNVDFKLLEIITSINGNIVQRYPARDMILPPAEIIMHLSRNMTLLPGDIICCGTSVGLGPMPRDCVVTVNIPGIGVLENRYL